MRTLALFPLLAASALAQNPAPPVFEVASVKINRHDPFVGRGLATNGDTLTIRNLNLRRIAAWAYNVQWPQIVGASWIDNDRFDITAKAAKASSEDEMRPMMQGLLAERFHFASHRETRQSQVLALTVPSGGHKMTPSKITQGPPIPREDAARGRVVEGVTLEEICEEMSHETGSLPVVNMTGLKGRFDFAFNLQKYRDAMITRARTEPRPSEADLRLSMMEELMMGELGLRLEARRVPVEFLVIDRADQKPVEN